MKSVCVIVTESPKGYCFLLSALSAESKNNPLSALLLVGVNIKFAPFGELQASYLEVVIHVIDKD